MEQKKKRDGLDIAGFILGIITVISTIIVSICFTKSFFDYIFEQGSEASGFYLVFIFFALIVLLFFVLAGIMEIIKFAGGHFKTFFIIQTVLWAMAVVGNFIYFTPLIEENNFAGDGVVIPVLTGLVCLILGIVKLAKRSRNKEKLPANKQGENNDETKTNTLKNETKIKANFCANCGNKLVPGANFCAYCGKEIK